MIEVEKEKILQFLYQHFNDLLDEKEGIKLAVRVINYASPKDKK